MRFPLRPVPPGPLEDISIIAHPELGTNDSPSRRSAMAWMRQRATPRGSISNQSTGVNSSPEDTTPGIIWISPLLWLHQRSCYAGTTALLLLQEGAAVGAGACRRPRPTPMVLSARAWVYTRRVRSADLCQLIRWA